MEEEIRTRRVVCRSHIIRNRLQGNLDHHPESPETRRHLPEGRGHNGIFQWKQLTYLEQVAMPK